MTVQAKLGKINSRTALYQFLCDRCYQVGTTPTKLSYQILHDNYDSYLHRIIMNGSKRLIRTKLNAIASFLSLPANDFWNTIKHLPNDHPRKRFILKGQSNKHLKNYLTCLLFLRHISFTQAAKESQHPKDWVEYRLYKTKNLQSKLNVLKMFAKELNVPLNDFQMVIKGNLKPFKVIMNKLTNKVHDRRSLLNLFMVACYLHGTNLSYMSSKYGYQHHYFGKAIKMRTQQTICKNLSSAAAEIGIYNLQNLVDQAKIVRAGKHTNMKGHGTYTSVAG